MLSPVSCLVDQKVTYFKPKGCCSLQKFGFINPTFLKLMNYSAGKVQKFTEETKIIFVTAEISRNIKSKP